MLKSRILKPQSEHSSLSLVTLAMATFKPESIRSCPILHKSTMWLRSPVCSNIIKSYIFIAVICGRLGEGTCKNALNNPMLAVKSSLTITRIPKAATIKKINVLFSVKNKTFSRWYLKWATSIAIRNATPNTPHSHSTSMKNYEDTTSQGTHG